jgi:hypothetical protein
MRAFHVKRGDVSATDADCWADVPDSRGLSHRERAGAGGGRGIHLGLARAADSACARRCAHALDTTKPSVSRGLRAEGGTLVYPHRATHPPHGCRPDPPLPCYPSVPYAEGGLPHSALATLASPLLPAHRGGLFQRGSATWDRCHVTPGLEGCSVILIPLPASRGMRKVTHPHKPVKRLVNGLVRVCLAEVWHGQHHRSGR